MKPQITLSKPLSFFLKDGKLISDEEARNLWNSLTADWSQGAYQMMAAKVMSENTRNDEDATRQEG